MKLIIRRSKMAEKKKKEKEEVIEGEVVKEEEKPKLVKELAIEKKSEDTALVPSAENILKLAHALHQSGMFPHVQNKYGALAIIEYGRELGIQPVIALQTMSVIQGKICIEAKVMLAMAEKKGVEVEILEKSKQISRVKFTKKGKEPFTEAFNIKDAERMGFLKKSNWIMYPEEMLFWRCISKGLRAYDPGSILGLYSREEMLDVGEDFVKPEAPPKETKKRSPKPKEEAVATRGKDEEAPEYQPPPGTEAEKIYEKEQEAREEYALPQEGKPPEVVEPKKNEITDKTCEEINRKMATLIDKYKRDPGKLLENIISIVEQKFGITPKRIPDDLTEIAGGWVSRGLDLSLEEAEKKLKKKEEKVEAF